MGRSKVGRKKEAPPFDSVPSARKTPAHEGKLGRSRDILHQGLRKAESLLAIQLRTEKVGFAAFLHARRVPDVVTPACRCGWRREDRKHVLNFSAMIAHAIDGNYSKQREKTGIRKFCRPGTDFERWPDGSWAGISDAVSLTKEKSDRAEGRLRDDGGKNRKTKSRSEIEGNKPVDRYRVCLRKRKIRYWKDICKSIFHTDT